MTGRLGDSHPYSPRARARSRSFTAFWLMGMLGCSALDQVLLLQLPAGIATLSGLRLSEQPKIRAAVYGAAGRSYASPNTVSLIHRLKPSLSTNCLNSSVSSFITPVMTRSRARSCSIRAFSLSEFSLAFLKAVSTATREGISSVMSRLTRWRSSHAMSPNKSLKVEMMFDKRSDRADR